MTRAAWEIADDMAHAFDPETGEVDIALWDDLQLELADKAEAVHVVIVRLAAEAAACSTESRRLAARSKAADARMRRLRVYLLDCMHVAGVENLRTATLTVSRRPGSERVDVADADALSDNLVLVERRPDRKAIAAAIKRGDDVRGAAISRGPDTLIFK